MPVLTCRRRRVFTPPKANNSAGRTGKLKCVNCRKQHSKVTSRSLIFMLKNQCNYPPDDENAPCEYCAIRDEPCIKYLPNQPPPKMKALQPLVENSLAVISPSPSPSATGYCEIRTQEQGAIHYLYETIANSTYYHRHRELFKSIQLRNGPYIQNPCLRHAAIGYAAFSNQKLELLRSSWSSFH